MTDHGMNERIAELEQGLEAWERRSRRRAALLVMVPLLTAVGLVLFLALGFDRREVGLNLALRELDRTATADVQSEDALARLAAARDELAALRRLPDELARLRGERDALQRDLTAARQELERLAAARQQTTASAEQALTDERRQREAALQDLAALRLERETLATDRQQAEAAAEQTGRELAAERERRSALEQELAAARRDLDGLTAARDQAARAAEESGDAVAEERRRRMLVEEELAVVRNQAVAGASRQSSLADELAAARSQLAALEAQLAESREQVRRLQGEQRDAAEQIAARQDVTQGEREVALARMNALGAVVQQLRQRIEAGAAERQALAAERDALTERLGLAESAALDLRQRTIELETAAREADRARVLAEEALQDVQASTRRTALVPLPAAGAEPIAPAAGPADVPVEADVPPAPPSTGAGEAGPAAAPAAVSPLVAAGPRANRQEPPGPLARIRTDLSRIDGLELIGGDRLVLTSGGLFAPGQADLSPAGQSTLAELAQRLRDALGALPAEASWLLRVEGHTDDTPVRRSPFRSNMELSVARADAVANHLARHGVPAQRLMVRGYADTRPLVPPTGESARSRNRRIELRLTMP